MIYTTVILTKPCKAGLDLGLLNGEDGACCQGRPLVGKGCSLRGAKSQSPCTAAKSGT